MNSEDQGKREKDVEGKLCSFPEDKTKRVKDVDGKWYTVNIRLLPLKAHYFMLAAGIASFQPYLPLHAKQVGLSATAVGTLYSSVSVVALVAKPFFGWVADKYRREKLLAAAMLLLSIIFYLVISFIPSIETTRDVKLVLSCNNSKPEIKELVEHCVPGPNRVHPCLLQCINCTIIDEELGSCVETEDLTRGNTTVAFTNHSLETIFTLENESEVECKEIKNLNCVLTCLCDEWCCGVVNEYHSLPYWIFFVCFIFVGMGERVLRSLSDSICYSMLGNRSKDYGRQRVWLAVGWCAAPFLTGYLLDITKTGNSHNYAVAGYALVVFMAVDIIVVSKLDLSEAQRRKKSENIWKDVSGLASKPRHLIAALTVCIGGIANGFDLVYYNIFMEEIGASRVLIGISMSCCLVTQLPVMFFSGDLIRRIGHFNCFALSLALTGLRFFSFIHIYNPYLVLAPQLLMRSGIDLFTICFTSYANAVAPPGTESTLQQVTGALFGGIGVGLGYALGGLSFDHYGSRKSFLIWFIILGITAFVNFTFANYNKLSCKKKQKEVYESVPIDLVEQHQQEKRTSVHDKE